MAERSERTRKFWDRIAEGYSKKPVSDEAAYQKKLQVTQTYLRPDMDVLEIGCGTGSTSIVHAPFVKHILATDISPKMIEIAKKKAVESKIENVTFKQSSTDELRIPDSSLDAVLGLSVLHLLKNREECISKTYEMLKPGGIFVTSTPCVGDMGVAKHMLKFIAPVGQLFGLIPPFYTFTAEELKQNFRDAGFSIDHEWRPENNAGKPKNDAAVFIIGRKSV